METSHKVGIRVDCLIDVVYESLPIQIAKCDATNTKTNQLSMILLSLSNVEDLSNA